MAPPPAYYHDPTLGLPQSTTTTDSHSASITYDAGAPPPTQEALSLSFQSSFTTTWTNTLYPEPSDALSNPSDPLGLDNLGGSSEWYDEPIVVLTAWCFIIYSLVSALAMVMMLSRGWLDWKLNLSPTAFAQENAPQDPWIASDNYNTRSHFRHREYEPRESVSDDGEDNERREIEWWEAVGMQPYRHLASRLRASRSLCEGGDRVAARIPMPRPGDIYSTPYG